MICSSHPASELRSRLQGWYTDHCRIRKRWWGKSEDLCHCRLNSKKFGPFHDVYFRAKCLGEAWMGRWRSQSKTVSHKYRITTIVTISLEWHFKSVCFFPLNLLHQRDVLNRKIPETIYYILLISFNGIKIQKHIASPAAVPGTCAGSCTSNLVSVRKINVWNFPMVGLCKLKAQMPANHWWLGCHVNFVPRLTLHESIWSNWRKNAHILTLLIFVYRIQLHDFQDISRISTSLPGLLWISPCFDWQTLRRSWWEIFCQELSC